MVQRVEGQHLVHIRPVPGGLEGVGLEAVVVVGKVKGKGVEGVALCCQLPAGKGGDHAGINAAGQKAAHRHIRHQLALHCIPQQPGDLFHRLGVGIGVGPGLQGPVGIFPHPSPGTGHDTARLHLPQAAEHPAAGGAGRAQAENFPEAVQICPGLNLRVGKQGFGL